jgi:hypothetical protein
MANKIFRGKKKRIGLSRREEEKKREYLLKTLPSANWVDATFVSYTDVTPEGKEITYRFHDERAFPPGGTQTAMVVCPKCGRVAPPNSIERHVYTNTRGCMDHQPEHIHEAYGPSPSAVAIENIRIRRLRIETVQLQPEDKSSLRREIRRALAKQNRLKAQ